MYDFSKMQDRLAEIVDWLGKEYTVIRTGQATPALLDSIQVESYGAKVPINQVGSVGAEDARTLRVSVWDAGNIHATETAIVEADLGVSVAADDAGLRVIFPELSGERREQLLKLAKNKLEEARVSIRTARDESKKAIEGDSELSDDQKSNAKESLQKIVDEHNQKLEDLFTHKENDIKL